MKDGHYWLQFLSEEERELFIKNISPANLTDFLNDTHDDFQIFIGCAFVWESTIQDHDFWLNISKREIE